MSDDSFIREVDDELRQDRMHGFWARYGRLIIAGAVLIVVATAGFRGWEYWRQTLAARSGDAFLAAAELSKSGKQDEAIAALEEIVKTGSGQYPALSRMRIAGETLARGDKSGAVTAFDAIASDNSFEESLRSVARIRAAMLAVDLETYDAVKVRLEPMAAAGQSFRSLARELLGISAYKAGKLDEAAKWFRQIADDANAVGNVRDRANVMLELLAGKGATGKG